MSMRYPLALCACSSVLHESTLLLMDSEMCIICSTYSRVPIRRGVRNKRSGTQDEKYFGQNISHMCLGLYSRCRFILTNLYLKVLHFDILIQLKDTAHFLGNVLGLIKGVC